MKRFILLIMSSLWVLAASFAGPDKTLKNLQKAYQQEGNNVFAYRIYADRAKEEGYDEVSTIYSVMAESELIQMKNHRRAIEEMGAEAGPVVYEDINVETTRKNLKETLRRESGEIRKLNDDYIKDAKKENAESALKSFEYAKSSDMEQRNIFRQALEDLGYNKHADYYISNVSGMPYAVKPGASAPEPTMSCEKFLNVND